MSPVIALHACSHNQQLTWREKKKKKEKEKDSDQNLESNSLFLVTKKERKSFDGDKSKVDVPNPALIACFIFYEKQVRFGRKNGVHLKKYSLTLWSGIMWWPASLTNFT
jgi:hypothetical protein